MTPPIRDAATVVVVRDAPEGGGIETLLLQRAQRGDHSSGAWVFPGGLVDPGDREAAAPACRADDAAAGVLAFRLAAIRECFEEAGLLFAVDAQGEFASLPGDAAELAVLRSDLREGRCTLADICRRFSLRPVPERLHAIGHWLTPLGRAKRFDTRFFLAVAPARQTALHDAGETLDHVWLAPDAALARTHGRRLMAPTLAMLEMIAPFATTASLAQWAAAPREIRRVLPRLAAGSGGEQTVLPDHPAYEEIGKLDPDGRCEAWCELRVGLPVALGPHVVRITGADGRNAYRTGSDALGWEDVELSTARLVEPDRIVIARDRSCVPPAMLAHADWLAPAEGFLQRLDPA